MDISKIYFLNEYYLLENLSVRLVEMDAVHGYKLMLASEIIQKPNNIYDITIKESYFSNGELISIEDVKNSLLRAKENVNSHVPFAEIVESIVVEDKVLSIKLKKPVVDFMYFLTLADLSVLHRSQITIKELKTDDWIQATSGPFSYKFEGEEVYLIKNSHYKLTNDHYPDKIKLISARGQDTFEDFKKDSVDLGEFNLNSYEKHLDKLSKEDNLKVIGNNGDMINFLALNANSLIFKKEYNRKWIQKKIILNFNLNPKYKAIARKAVQFFTPQVRGFLSEDLIIKEVSSWSEINMNVIPEDLKNGITIKTYQRAYEVSLRSVIESLGKTLGIPVRIEPDVASPKYEEFVKKNDFDVFLGITAMDQIIVGESINLYYFSSQPLLKDVNHQISNLMEKYHKSDALESTKILNDIALQMVKDAECIPLFYVASPFFYNSKKLDVSSLDELTYFNLWKIKTL